MSHLKKNLRPIWVSEALPPGGGGEGTSAGACSRPLPSNYHQGEEWMEMYLHSPTCLQDYHCYQFTFLSRYSMWGFASDVVWRQFGEHADGSSNSIKALNLFYVIRRLGGALSVAAVPPTDKQGETTTALELPTKARLAGDLVSSSHNTVRSIEQAGSSQQSVSMWISEQLTVCVLSMWRQAARLLWP
jgi:hypothetical protein